MKYHNLTTTKHKGTRRVGRGISAGQGKTAGRGTKGQKSRTGVGRRPGFEGGQNPLIQRLPKLKGFKSHRKVVENVFTSQLNNLTGVIDNFKIAEAGLTSSPYVSVKLILKGDVAKKVSVKLQAISAGAEAAVKKAGGSFDIVPQVARSKKEKS